MGMSHWDVQRTSVDDVLRTSARNVPWRYIEDYMGTSIGRLLGTSTEGVILPTGLAVIESLSSKNKNVKYLLCVKNDFIKYAWVKPLKDKKGKTVLNAFIQIVNESNRKPNKLWVDQEREFYNKPMQEWLANNDI